MFVVDIRLWSYLKLKIRLQLPYRLNFMLVPEFILNMEACFLHGINNIKGRLIAI